MGNTTQLAAVLTAVLTGCSLGTNDPSMSEEDVEVVTRFEALEWLSDECMSKLYDTKIVKTQPVGVDGDGKLLIDEGASVGNYSTKFHKVRITSSATDSTTPSYVYILRHELMHAALYCEYGYGDSGHTFQEWHDLENVR